MHTGNPVTDKPVPQSPGTGKLGLGYGLRRNTPGLPVQNPTFNPSVPQDISKSCKIQLLKENTNRKKKTHT